MNVSTACRLALEAMPEPGEIHRFHHIAINVSVRLVAATDGCQQLLLVGWD